MAVILMADGSMGFETEKYLNVFSHFMMPVSLKFMRLNVCETNALYRYISVSLITFCNTKIINKI